MNEFELVERGGNFNITESLQRGTSNFMSWERLNREVLKHLYPDERVTGITVSERGLEIRLEPIPKESTRAI